LTIITLAIDAMGGDIGLPVTVPAAIKALKKHLDLHLILVGNEPLILKQLASQRSWLDSRLSIYHTEQVVEMNELPSSALRNKKKSSLRKSINLIKEGRAQACVSAGNTGALMATARFVLRTLPGIERPAIISALPTTKGKTRVLDLGANVDSCAEHLYQFAIMGSILASALDNIEKPTVGLLNIGVEEIKGNDQVKRTAHLLAESENINYIGFIEGNDIFNGRVDVVVCDGFVGNVALKSCEGTAKLMAHFIRSAFNKNLLTKFIGLLALPVLSIIKKRMDPSRYNGASLLGVNGIVIKSHGSANILGFTRAIDEAIAEVYSNVPDLIRQQVADYLIEEDDL
jgi:glycerol-3-phosphate acyltransferase PlsX